MSLVATEVLSSGMSYAQCLLCSHSKGQKYGWTTESIQECHFQHEYLQEDKPHSAAYAKKRLGKVGSVNPVLVRAAKDGRNADSSRQLLSEARPGTAGTITSVAVLSEGDLVTASVTAAPLRPALGVDDVRQSGVLEDNASVVPPGAAEVVGTSLYGVPGSSRDLGLVDDVVGRVGIRVATVGCDVAKGGSEDTDVDTIEPGGGLLSEDKVYECTN